MAILDTIKSLWSRTVNIATTPIQRNGTSVQLMPAVINRITALSDTERKRQEAIIVARRFHDGLHDTRLTDRLKEFLGDDNGQFAMRLNFIRKINRAISERLIIEGFDCDAADTEKERQLELANAVYHGSRMKGKRSKVFQEMVRDGEYFYLIDWDFDNKRPRRTPMHRYTDPQASEGSAVGDGEGLLLFYPNDDVDQKPEFAAQRWTETAFDNVGNRVTQKRITIYYANKIERYVESGVGWMLKPLVVGDTERPAEQWWTDNGQENGVPLGIPVVHCKTPELRPAASEAIPIQKGANKTYIDMLMASDIEAFRLLFAFGWQPENADGTPLEITPGTIMGTTTDGASIEAIDGSDSAKFIEVIDKQIALMADVTDTPLSLINRSNQRAAEGTLQEEKDSFFAKVRDYQETVEMAFEDAFRLERRLHNMMNPQQKLSEDVQLKVLWAPLSVRNVEEKAREAEALLASGATTSYVQRTVWGIATEEIEAMEDDRRAALYGEDVARTADTDE